MHVARSLVTLAALLAACSPPSLTPDSAFADECGPIKVGAAQPNTLLDSIGFPATLKKSCSPYYFTDPVAISSELTIEAGVTLIGPMGGKRSRLTITPGGLLLATGTAEEPITFTSTYAASGGVLGGQWSGILFLESRPGSHLEHVIIEYAGGRYMRVVGDDEFGAYEFPVDGSLLNDSTPNLEVVDVIIRRSNGYAIAATTSDPFDTDKQSIYAAMDRVSLSDNQRGLWLPVNQGGALGPDLCFVPRAVDGTCPADPAPAGHFVELHLDSNFGRTPESVNHDAVWKPYGAPFQLDTVNVVGGALLEVLDGAELRMTQVGGISVGLNEPGAIRMVGTAARGITITSATANPTPAQYWNGISIWDMADERTHLEGVDISYGGRRAPILTEAPALVMIYNSNPTLVGNHVHHSVGAGIHWNCQSDPGGLEEPPLPSTNTSDDATIACAALVGSGIAENYGCACPMGGCMNRCPPTGL
ncbi:MAG: hypothetical protein EXR73_04350 [Myxococcales bacterium]|nr:hypothetical protein [Myxococcales bacterium]